MQRSVPLAEQPRECPTFRLGGEEYSIDILTVQEIRGYEAPARLATAPAFVKDVANLRGRRSG
jgi:purine-binding chemotaxis protein CheW